MVFSSVIFLLYFLPPVLAVNYLLPSRFRNYWLLLVSLIFYAWGAPTFIPILLVSVIANFWLVKGISKSQEFNRKKWLLFISILINVGLLAYFKYFNFFIENVNVVLHQIGLEPTQYTKVVLPIGISFFTFQSLSYSIDVYRNHHHPLDKLSDYMLYILLFPQMIAGPIVRFSAIADDLITRRIEHSDLKQGLLRFIIGLSKKVLIANTLAEFSSENLDLSATQLNATTAWLGILAYTFQIYFDFSGYSDMAIGMGRMLGFKFPENFNSPYISKSITEFWRRWHITLGTWMRDYLYIPLGGNKVSSNGRLYFNLIFVFLISGLWHGASWNFVIWGAYHGLFLVVERLFLKKYLQKLPAFLSLLYSFLVVAVGWVFFSIESLNEALAYLQLMGSFNFEWSELLLERRFLTTLIVAMILSFATQFKWGIKLENILFEGAGPFSARLSLHLGAIILFALSFIHLVGSGFNPFIYFRF